MGGGVVQNFLGPRGVKYRNTGLLTRYGKLNENHIILSLVYLLPLYGHH
jgi:hypothetical protein